jgi:hypothetical protein
MQPHFTAASRSTLRRCTEGLPRIFTMFDDFLTLTATACLIAPIVLFVIHTKHS